MADIVKRSAAAFLDVTRHALGAGRSVRFRAEGASMRPAIGNGDLITVETVDPSRLQCGDVIVYHGEVRPVAHRIVQVRTTPTGQMVVVARGDATGVDDEPVEAAAILGKVTAIEHSPQAVLPGLRALLWRRVVKDAISLFWLPDTI
jgi:signal peptidase I